MQDETDPTPAPPTEPTPTALTEDHPFTFPFVAPEVGGTYDGLVDPKVLEEPPASESV